MLDSVSVGEGRTTLEAFHGRLCLFAGRFL